MGLNYAFVMGRLTRDPEVRQTGTGKNVCSFSVAVDRDVKDANGERGTDFIRCVAWQQSADFLARFFRKGSMVCVQGRLQVRQYDDQNGQKREITELIVDRLNFTGEKANQGGSNYDIPLPPDPMGYTGNANYDSYGQSSSYAPAASNQTYARTTAAPAYQKPPVQQAPAYQQPPVQQPAEPQPVQDPAQQVSGNAETTDFSEIDQETDLPF
ncbi:MAG: single-stranded DNA-binding protein [Oscillospiraceae bacterium]|jgi:single-strand DNA-binding protein|nr:single-stranded DNA-binding protein [Oscillospiraceae bacterium]